MSSRFSKLWQKWRALKLPWRRRWLAGTDLAGNKYWYFRSTLGAPRARRILQHNPRIPYSDIKIPPQWHQWLRYTRPSPPSLEEQRFDLTRQAQLKLLAKAADEKWAAKPSVLDKPRRGNFELAVGDGETVGTREEVGGGRERETKDDGGEEKEKWKGKENPWKMNRGRAGEEWQPEAWTPGLGKR